jgi:uncharacterized protein YoxC
MPKDKKPREAKPAIEPTTVERIIASIGSVGSLAIHTLAFACFFLLSVFGVLEWSLMLLILTTILSLEAIYLAIFIQITVNRHTQSLKEVEEDIDEIQEDVEELGEDMEDIQEDLEEISEDIDEIQEDMEEISEDIDEIQEDVEELNEEDGADKALATPKARGKKPTQAETLERLAADVARVLADLEALKKAGK